MEDCIMWDSREAFTDYVPTAEDWADYEHWLDWVEAEQANAELSEAANYIDTF